MGRIEAEASLLPIPASQNCAIGTPYQPQQYIVLPLYYTSSSDRLCRRFLSFSTFIIASIVILSTLFFLWPSHPNIEVVRVHLNRISVSDTSSLFPRLDIWLDLTIRARNPDFFSLDYTSLTSSIGYRSKTLGFVVLKGATIKARSTSYLNASLHLNGIEIFHDVIYLIQDLAKGVIPFDTQTRISGGLKLLFVDVPIKETVSCEVYVNTTSETITQQNCYPE